MNSDKQTAGVNLFKKAFFGARAKLFGVDAQPSVRRGVFLLAALVVFNILVGIATFMLGARYPVLSGLSVLAWGFGFRHAMDADHIAAIDNVTRRLLYRGKHSVGVGVFFALGHSTIVFLLTLLVLFFTPFAQEHFDAWKGVGAVIGATVSSVFLLGIGIINIVVLFKLFAVWKDLRAGKENAYHGHMHLGGPIEKIFRPLLKLVDQSYKMYFVGFLFGLGFDTATEVGLLAISALAVNSVPPIAVLLLPLSFMAGMTLLDTLNGLCMLGIYAWGVIDENRRVLYNINITLISLLSALLIGITTGLRIIGSYFGLHGGVFYYAQNISLNYVGYGLLALFVLIWVFALVALRAKSNTPNTLSV